MKNKDFGIDTWISERGKCTHRASVHTGQVYTQGKCTHRYQAYTQGNED